MQPSPSCSLSCGLRSSSLLCCLANCPLGNLHLSAQLQKLCLSLSRGSSPSSSQRGLAILACFLQQAL